METMFRNRWWMVVVAILGLICGPGPINIFTFGVFLKPITAELGVSRGLLSLALMVTTTTGAFINFVIGWLIDRFGTRRVLITLIPLYALSVIGYSLLTASIAVIMAVFLGVGLIASICGPVGYASLVSKWFDRERGLALGIAMAGVGLGTAIIPPLSAFLITTIGWRGAYRCLAALIIILAWLPAFIVRDPAPGEEAGTRDPQDGALVGLLASQAIAHSWRFWALTAAFFFGVAAINGVIAHAVPLLTDRGISLEVATSAVAASGIAIIVGRILSGWCLDRMFGPFVAVGFFVVPMAGIVLLAVGNSPIVLLIGAFLSGLAVGAEVDLMAFFVSRYFGLKAYGRIYGTMFAFFAAANGVGPFIAGFCFDRFHSYRPALIIFEVFLVVTCVLFLPLGRYPYPARHRAPPRDAHRVPA